MLKELLKITEKELKDIAIHKDSLLNVSDEPKVLVLDEMDTIEKC